MPPLLKSLLKTKARISRSNSDRLWQLNESIFHLISENRRPPNYSSCSWWKEVDSLTQRRTSITHSIAALVRTDDTYVNPSSSAIGSNANIHEITEHEFWHALRTIERTAIGPDLIPFWICKEHGENTHTCHHKDLESLYLHAVVAMVLGKG